MITNKKAVLSTNLLDCYLQKASKISNLAVRLVQLALYMYLGNMTCSPTKNTRAAI